MGLSKNFQVVEKKISAFKSNNVGQILNDQKTHAYKDIKELKKRVLVPLNAEFSNDNTHVLFQTPMYINMRCKYKECTF